MLDTALLVAARRSQVEQEKVATAKLLDQLPLEVLREIAETGEVKLAYGLCSPDGPGAQSWVEQFKGTPFFQQAIALEQEDLQAQTANQQSSAVQRQKMDQEFAVQDQIRLKKKLLELQKARNEAQVLDTGAGGAAMAGSPDPTGTAPGGPAGPPMEDLKTVTASAALDKRLAAIPKSTGVKRLGELFTGSRAEKLEKEVQRTRERTSRRFTAPGYSRPQIKDEGVKSLGVRAGAGAAVGLGAAGAHYALKDKSEDKPKMSKSASIVEGWARDMAREDAAKVAHAQEVFSVGDAAGRAMAKVADMSELVGKGLSWAAKNPAKAGAIAGAGLNAGREALKHDSSLGDVAGAAITGGAAGHAIGGIGGGMVGKNGKDFGGALTGYVKDTSKSIKDLATPKAD